MLQLSTNQQLLYFIWRSAFTVTDEPADTLV